MPTDRTTIVKGAGAVKIGSVQLYSKGEIGATLDPETFEIPVAGYGSVDERLADSIGRITFTPSGRLSADILTALFPYGTPVIDASVFGSTDTATEVHSIAGQKVVFHNTAVTRMPALKLSARETAFAGAVEITAISAKATARTNAAAIFTGPTAAAFTPNITVADIKTLPYVGTWGTGGGAVTIETKEGWDVEFDVTLEPMQLADHGTVDMYLKSVTARARCIPLNYAENMLALLHTQGAAAVIGSTMREGKNLAIAATGGLTVTLFDAAPVSGPIRWGESMLRAGELGFKATRAFSGGVPGALFSVAMTA
jgi:hypothetical protein